MKSERLVYKYYKNLGFVFIAHRMRLKFAEIDLIFKKNQTIVLIEVKTLSSSDFINNKISKTQRIRLENAYRYFINRYPSMDIEYHYVVVEPGGEISVFDSFLGEGWG